MLGEETKPIEQPSAKSTLSKKNAAVSAAPDTNMHSMENIAKDGIATIPLWLALRQHYRRFYVPKTFNSPHLPIVVKQLLIAQHGQGYRGNSSSTYWSFEGVSPLANTELDAALASQSLGNMYIYQQLIKTLVWIAPDHRYNTLSMSFIQW